MCNSASSVARKRLLRRRFVKPVSCLLSMTLLSFALLTITGAADSLSLPAELELTTIQPSTFRLQVEKPGVVEPLESEVVRSSCYWSTTILSIVPEGTWVQKGDVVCVLDSSEIEDYARTREIILIKYRGRLDNAVQDEELQKSTNERKLTAARFKHQTAAQDLEEYQYGTFPQDLEEMERNLAVMAEQSQSQTDQFRHSERLWAMGMKSRESLQRESLQLLKTRQGYERLESKLHLLTGFTHPRSMLSLDYSARNAERNLARTKISNSIALTKANLTRL